MLRCPHTTSISQHSEVRVILSGIGYTRCRGRCRGRGIHADNFAGSRVLPMKSHVHRLILLGQRRTVGTVILCLLIGLTAVVSGQNCSPGSSSIDGDGIGNDEAKALLQPPTEAACSGYLAALLIATASEVYADAVVVGLNAMLGRSQ